MEPHAIAALLRVEVSTVAVYVLQAIKCERFGFEERRARVLIPHAPIWMRDDYKAMISKRVKERDNAAQMEEGAMRIRRQDSRD